MGAPLADGARGRAELGRGPGAGAHPALTPGDLDAVSARLARAGFIAAAEEASELLAAADGDGARLEAMLQRRLTGEPLAWITARVRFCGLDLHVDPGVYVPRWHTELIAERAAALLPPDGVAVDVCTGCGAVAAVLQARRPGAWVLATDVDAAAVACARRNGVDARRGDLLEPLPESVRGGVDLVTAVVPYVPGDELPLLQRDTFTFETPLAYDGGDGGLAVLRRLLREARALLRPGGAAVLELGGRQPEALRADLRDLGYAPATVLRDEDGDVRGIETRLRGTRP